ncbi:MAG: nucleotidyltransferase family protein [Prevotella sp.]|nr:nucleotidyltransferase family protein [Prevotella sp.]MBQ4296420.1 nucleotidyltransferase family protein [Prevotella sp.]
MKNIIIAAGYATRLYPLTENYPKPLLKVGNRSILERLLDDIDPMTDIDEHIIVTNHKFAPIFEQWLATVHYQHPIRIIDDGTTSNDNRLGAVRDLLLAIEKCAVDDDIMVLAADNILTFSLKGFVDFFKERQSSVIMCYHEPELRRLQRTGVIEVDSQMRVLQMQEKPEKPVSEWAVPPFYIYRREDLPLIRDCMAHGCGFDAPGNLAHYLVEVTTMHAWPMPGGRYDIGSLDSYEEAQRLFG